MNRLELAQQLRRDCGISGSENTTAGATGEWADIVSWIDRAWRDIQLARQDWLWMRKSFSFATTASQATYSPTTAPISLTDFKSWVPYSFRIYKDSIANEIVMNYWDSYDAFRDTYLIGTFRSSAGQPTEICVSPDKSLVLALPPLDTSYTVLGDYMAKPSELTSDASTPEMPEHFHMLVVYEAMKFAGFKESASELLMMHKNERNRLMTLLEIDQLPSIKFMRSW